jgi:Uma2 family endonuclease
MSAVPRKPGRGYAGLRMTAEAFLALGETDEHYELIDGVVCMSPTPSPLHQKILRLIQRQLEAFIDANPGFDFYPDTDVTIDSRYVLAPDLTCYRPGRVPAMPQRLTVPPDLAIEILSPSNRAYDLTQQRALYERFGVGEYWVIDPATGNVRCFRLHEGRFEEAAVDGETLESSMLTGFVLDLKPLRAVVRAE